MERLALCPSIVFWSFFFFKQKTAYDMHFGDWSSDVCSSDLLLVQVSRFPDSILDYTKESQEIGKPVLEDMRQGVYSLPLI